MKIEINPEHLAHRLAMDKVEKKYQDLYILGDNGRQGPNESC